MTKQNFNGTLKQMAVIPHHYIKSELFNRVVYQLKLSGRALVTSYGNDYVIIWSY